MAEMSREQQESALKRSDTMTFADEADMARWMGSPDGQQARRNWYHR